MSWTLHHIRELAVATRIGPRDEKNTSGPRIVSNLKKTLAKVFGEVFEEVPLEEADFEKNLQSVSSAGVSDGWPRNRLIQFVQTVPERLPLRLSGRTGNAFVKHVHGRLPFAPPCWLGKMIS
jgi:hypothetical protein